MRNETKQSNDDIIKILSKINWGISLYRVVKLYILMSLIRNKSNRTHTSKDTKISLRTIQHRIDEMRYDGLDYSELLNQNDMQYRIKREKKIDDIGQKNGRKRL